MNRGARWPKGLVRLATCLAWGWTACGGGEPGRVDLGPGSGLAEVQVSWRLEDPDGASITCARLAIQTVRVTLAGRQEQVGCGTQDQVRFELVAPGRYPLRIELRDGAGALVEVYTEPVDVAAFDNIQVFHRFVLQDPGPSEGDLTVRWTVDGQPASAGCAVTPGAEVELSAQPGSIDESLEARVACAGGSATFVDRRPGDYIIRGRLIGPGGGVAISVDQDSVEIEANQEADLALDFRVVNDDPATLHSEWTLAGAVPASGCAEQGGERVRVRVQRLNLATMQFATIATSTAACEQGRLDTENLSTGSNGFRILYDLIDTSLLDEVVISSTLAFPISLRPAETTTVSVDFPPRQ